MGIVPRASIREEKRGTLALVLAVATLALLGLLVLPCTARADRVVSVSNPEYEAALEQLNSISEEYDALTQEQNQTLAQLEDVQRQIADTEAQIADVQQQIETGQEELAAQQDTLAGHISASYKSGGVSWLGILFSATSFEDAVSKFYYHNAINEAQVAEIESINEKKAELQEQSDELQRLQDELLEQEADIKELYDQQQERAEEMYDRQLRAAELVESLPSEILQTIEEDPQELVNEAQAAIHAEEERAEAEAKPEESKPEESKPAEEEKPAEQKEETPAPAQPTSSAPSGTLQRLIDTAYATGPTRQDWGCSGWVYIVFDTAGISDYSGSAAYFYNTWCFSSDRSQLRPGMIIAVNNTGGSAAGRMYGHIGIYLGNNTVRHFTRGQVFDMSLDDWCRSYGSVCTPRWGWNGGVVLS